MKSDPPAQVLRDIASLSPVIQDPKALKEQVGGPAGSWNTRPPLRGMRAFVPGRAYLYQPHSFCRPPLRTQAKSLFHRYCSGMPPADAPDDAVASEHARQRQVRRARGSAAEARLGRHPTCGPGWAGIRRAAAALACDPGHLADSPEHLWIWSPRGS